MTKNTKSTRVAVLVGGPSPEHDISLTTGEVIAEVLGLEVGYHVELVSISRDGRKWHFPNAVADTLGSAIDTLQNNFDVAFIAMHGTFGEDGTIQGLLEFAGIPYTGSDVLASSLAMNKAKTKELLKVHLDSAISTPDFSLTDHQLITRIQFEHNAQACVDRVVDSIGFPCIVKPNKLGSSVGIGLAHSSGELIDSIQTAIQSDTEVLVEPFLRGKEVTCAVLGESAKKQIDAHALEPSQALQPTEIVPTDSEYFDIKAKYTQGAAQEITPPDLPNSVIERIQRVAVTCHNALGCEGLSRTDIIIVDEEFYVLEVNTIPGMTHTSLYPQALAHEGISFGDFLKRLVELALERYYESPLEKVREANVAFDKARKIAAVS